MVLIRVGVGESVSKVEALHHGVEAFSCGSGVEWFVSVKQ